MTGRKWIVASSIVVVLVVAIVQARSLAQQFEPQRRLGTQAAALGADFTYQGQLKRDGRPVNDDCEMAFRLYDGLGGIQVGTAITHTVSVSNSLFTVNLDFSDVFTGDERWLGIRVMCPGDSSYADLGQQKLSGAPYALYARSTGALQGHPVTATLPATNQVLKWNGSVWSPATSQPANVIVVAKSDGDFTSIQAALDSITGTAENRYLVYVAPGTYSETVRMKEYVDIQGAGELLTRITAAGSSSQYSATVTGANDAELRFLTVENTGGANFALAIYNYVASPRLTHVTAIASGGSNTNYGISNWQSSSPMMTHVTISASGEGSSDNLGIYNRSSSSPTMTNVIVSAFGGNHAIAVQNVSSDPTMQEVIALAAGASIYNYGVASDLGSEPTMMDVTATASGASGSNNYGVSNASEAMMTNVIASASGGTYNYGVKNYLSYPATLVNVMASASGGTYNYGVHNERASLTIRNCTITASGGNSFGVYNRAAIDLYTVAIDNSQITAGTHTIYNDDDTNHYHTYVGSSLLSGGVVTGTGTLTCIGAYDENYTALNSVCK
jgi:hypothetical protein